MAETDNFSRYEATYSIRYAKFRMGLLLVAFLPMAAIFAFLGVTSLFLAGFVWTELVSGANFFEATRKFSLALFTAVLMAFVISAAYRLSHDFFRNLPAAVLSREYIEGTGVFRKKRFLWRDVERIDVERGIVQIACKPTSKLQKWTAILTLGIFENKISIHPFFVEDTVDQMISALRYYSGKSYG